jgi:hypothetical protein
MLSVPREASSGSADDQRRRPAMMVAGLSGLIATWVMTRNIARFGLRDDEAFSISTSWRSWSSLGRLSLESETNGFLYAVGLKIWMIGGMSPGWLRVPSAAAVVIAVAIIAWLSTRLVNRTAGLISGAVLIFNGSAFGFGQYIRFYAPVMMLAAVSIAAWTADIGRPRRSTLSIWAVCSIAIVSSHIISACLVVGQLVALFMLSKPDRQWRRRTTAMIPAGMIGVVTAYLVSSHAEGQEINLPLGTRAIADVAYSLSGSGGWKALTAYGVVGLLALTATASMTCGRPNAHSSSDGGADGGADVLAHRRLIQFRAMVAAPWIIILVGLTMLSVASLFTNAMVGRYTAFLLPAVALGLGNGIGLALHSQTPGTVVPVRSLAGVALPRATRPPWGARQLVTCLGMLLIIGFGSTSGTRGWRLARTEQRTDWSSVVNTLASQTRPEDGVLFANDSIRLFFEYEKRRRTDLILPSPRFPSVPWGAFGTGDHRYVPFDVADVEAAWQRSDRLWLVIETPLLENNSASINRVFDRFHPTLIDSPNRTAVIYRLDRSNSSKEPTRNNQKK